MEERHPLRFALMRNWDPPACIVNARVNARNARNVYFDFRECWVGDVHVDEEVNNIITSADREVNGRSWLKNHVVPEYGISMGVVVIQRVDMTERQASSMVIERRKIVCGYVEGESLCASIR